LAGPAAAQPVAVGDLGIVADAPVYIAIEDGYFAKQNITVTLERFASAAQTTLPLSTDQLQVAGGGMSAGLFNAFARGLPLRLVMARTRDKEGFSSDTLLLRDDLRASVRSVKDLKGRKIAVNAPAGALDYMVGKMLELDGLSAADVDVTYMPWPDMGVAFANKAIDAGAVTEPFAVQYDERKLAFPFKRAAEMLRDPPLEISVILYSKNWIDRQPDQARAFTIAYLQGVRDYYDAMHGGAKRPHVVDILVKHTALKDKALYDRIQWSYMDPNAEMSLASLRDQQAWYAKRGAIEKPVVVETMLDNSFRDYALGKLGRVEVK
jgi:NitT/TauT family transport system substrate-binding protein